MAKLISPDDAPGVNMDQSVAPYSPTAAETAAWDEYAALLKRSQSTMDIQDGIAAGKAWGRWVRMFERPVYAAKCAGGSNVIYLEERP